MAECVGTISAHLDNPRVVGVRSDPDLGRARIRFESAGVAGDGVATCQWRTTQMGGIRLTSVAINGRRILDLELLVRNADLLLQEMQVAGGPLR